ncbi:beta-lactamase-like protein [Ilyonectria robusta]
MEPGYFPTWMPFFHLAVDMYLRQHEGIGARLQQRNLQASCVTLWSQDLDTNIQSVLEMRARLEAIFISEAVLMGYQHSYPPTMLSLLETFHLRSYSYSSILTWMHPPNPEYYIMKTSDILNCKSAPLNQFPLTNESVYGGVTKLIPWGTRTKDPTAAYISPDMLLKPPFTWTRNEKASRHP